MIRRLIGASVLSLSLLTASPALAQIVRSWDHGAGTLLWGDDANWSPNGAVTLAGAPLPDIINIGDLPAAANDSTLIDAAYLVTSLTITNGADVINSPDSGTTDFTLGVTGATTISGNGSSMTIYGGNPNGLDTGTLTINSGADLILNSQQPVGTAVVEVDSGLLTNNAGGVINGNGRIELDQAVGAVTTLLNNAGTLTASYLGISLGLPPATTLQIVAADADARIDLDGIVGNAGIVNVFANATLNIDVPISDAFGGDLNLSAGATLDMADPWTINGGTIDVNTPGGIVGTAGPAAHIAGEAITMSGGTLTLNDGNDSLAIDTGYFATGGTIANSGTIIFNAATTIGAAVGFTMNGGDSKLIVNSTVNIDTPNFNLDGPGLPGNSTTIGDAGTLDLDLGAGADEDFSHTININGGELDVTTTDNNWSINGVGTINAGGAAVSNINGETFHVAGTGGIHVAANSTLNVNTPTEITGAASITVAAGALLDFGTVSYGNAAATYTGDGTLRKGTATINAPTTWNVATVILDDGATTLNEDLTILTTAIGSAPGDGFDGTMTINDTFLLTATIAGTNTWTVDSAGVINYAGNSVDNSYLAGSDIVMNGTINHVGDGRIDARLDIGATGVINIATAAKPLRLSGGDGTTNLNTIAGGVINGLGILGADTEIALRGFGMINTAIDFDGSASLYADDGTLTINGPILDLNLLSVFNDGAANVTNAWNTNVVGAVSLFGGQLTGAPVTIDNMPGIGGNGLISARVINNTRLRGHSGGTLILETMNNDNDWDGAGAGRIIADGADVELRDNMPFNFSGTVEVQSGRRVLANGFALHFQPGSTLTINEGMYESTSSTDLRGAVNVGAGADSTLKVAVNFFLDFESTSTTTLNGNLRLVGNNVGVEAGATFSGPGALIIPDNSHMTSDPGANINVLLDNDGAFRPGGIAGVGRVDLKDYQQSDTGELHVELAGTSLNEFDRLVVNGAALVEGLLKIDVDVPYVPALGDSFNIITASAGVTGTFDLVDFDNVPDDFTFYVNYIPNAVQLQVVNKPMYAADFDDDGDVDVTDLKIWRNSFNLNQLGDANGDNLTNSADWVIWRDQLGLGPLPPGVSSFAGENVPEPAAWVLVVSAMIALSMRRAQHRPVIFA